MSWLLSSFLPELLVHAMHMTQGDMSGPGSWCCPFLITQVLVIFHGSISMAIPENIIICIIILQPVLSPLKTSGRSQPTCLFTRQVLLQAHSALWWVVPVPAQAVWWSPSYL